jgi:hypothetical protein
MIELRKDSRSSRESSRQTGYGLKLTTHLAGKITAAVILLDLIPMTQLKSGCKSGKIHN